LETQKGFCAQEPHRVLLSFTLPWMSHSFLKQLHKVTFLHLSLSLLSKRYHCSFHSQARRNLGDTISSLLSSSHQYPASLQFQAGEEVMLSAHLYWSPTVQPLSSPSHVTVASYLISFISSLTHPILLMLGRKLWWIHTKVLSEILRLVSNISHYLAHFSISCLPQATTLVVIITVWDGTFLNEGILNPDDFFPSGLF